VKQVEYNMELMKSQQPTHEDPSSSRGYSNIGDVTSIQSTSAAERLANTLRTKNGENSESELDMDDMVIRPYCRTQCVLRQEGSNYEEWKTFISSRLNSSMDALDVSTCQQVPHQDKVIRKQALIQQRKFNEGDQAERYILLSSLEPPLAVFLFYDEFQTMTVPEMCRVIRNKFSKIK
jgi:hypothetical protein